MKKFIITHEQLLAIAGETTTNLIASSLKPIEPLSDQAIYDLISSSAHVEGKYMLPFAFAREIEAHITGDKE